MQDPCQLPSEFTRISTRFFRGRDRQTKLVDSIKREQLAYELVLNKFDAMLGCFHHETGDRQRGLAIHDRPVVAEDDIQAWTDARREASGNSNARKVPSRSHTVTKQGISTAARSSGATAVRSGRSTVSSAASANKSCLPPK